MKIWMERILHVGLGMFLLMPSMGYSVNFAQRPLSVGNAVEPNVMFLLDDSGSMEREYMPDSIGNDWGADSHKDCNYCVREYEGDNVDHPWYYSGEVNTVFYNPDITYEPPYRENGSGQYPDSSITGAYTDGYNQSGSVDLTERFYHRGLWFEEGFYWDFDQASCTAGSRNDSCYSFVSVDNLTASQQTNYANWFSYYRTRMYMSRAGIGKAFYDLENNFRLGWGRINAGSTTVDGASGINAVRQGVRSYDAAHKEDFYDFLYSQNSSGSTPLRRALEGAGNYYENSGRAWADDPSQNVSSATNPERECRLAYSILMTDGLWNQGAPSSAISNDDNKDGDEISQGDKSYQYIAQAPFNDSYDDTLADVAMYFWKRDLRPQLGNYVPQKTVQSIPTGQNEEPVKSPAFWQHMVTYGVGLGVDPSSVTDIDAAFKTIRDGTAIAWPEPKNNNAANIDDLLHAAMNSYGGFFSASNPQTFSDELSQVLAELTADPGSSTSAEVAGDTVAQGELLFAASYDPSDWTGDLKAATFGTGANLIPDFDAAANTANGWSAAAGLDDANFDPSNRMVMTYVDGDGAPFRWAELNTAQMGDLSYDGNAALGQARLNFIRGDKSREDAPTAPSFRGRTSILGSVVNSSPNYVGEPSSGWPDTGDFGVDGERYSDFVADRENRNPVVYVGSNDGMLHGFQATLGTDGGKELFAYIPSFIYSDQAGQGLHHLTETDYTHRYYVDLATRKQDVYTYGRNSNNGNANNNRDWRTILVGGARAGGKGIFALDVTDPSQFSEANAPGLALWEFTSADDSRLGYLTQPPVIALSEWGGQTRWSVFLANGYNSDTATTGFFVLDVEGGLDGTWTANTDYVYVEFENGGDGLSPLTVLDTSGNYLADRIYAGDLDGQVWVSSISSGSWTTAYSDPLFTASGPITGAVAVGANKATPRAGNLPNLMVYFGTGKYLETADTTDTSTQAFYGVWDRGDSDLSSSSLVQRTLTEEERDVEGETKNIRVSDGDPVNYTTQYGWWAPLPDTGERVINNPIVRGDYVYINTVVPSADPCAGGGSGWIMAFGRRDGLAVNNSKAFSKFPSDTLGYQTEGIPSQLIIRDNTLIYDVSGGDPVADELPPLGSDVPGAGRRGWHELLD